MSDHDDIAAAVQKRKQFERRLRSSETPEERLARFAELQRRCFAILEASPEGYRHFLRRNFHCRRAEVIDGQWQPVSPDRRASLP